ncbi:putative membrane protein [Streptomyces davaonensis JCM 4913]|uniref:Putative membrane protein n=1 Tax=Streptomyces davaonensis (strain DSM 101723 / JCM 4913 / KCC S-0913 / 768) TaxID=1214101 RepID=K4R6C4_STRDJ|nr:hypothetical protein [Streptomyces davaonensis]CCK28883.1 putative membrane protein [Streptomyces davaonensis JCM 4913]
MNGAEATRPDPETAAAALRGSEAARAAADGHPRALPGWLPAAQGLLCAGGFAALGLSLAGSRWNGLLVAVALICLVGLLGMNWLGMHHGGVAPWFAPRGARSPWQSWVLPAAPLALGLLGWLVQGPAGGFVAFGIAAGLAMWARGPRQHDRTRTAS